ncbi:transmembrane protein, putative [Medicago truncatula]|uniref:Transmembrane protein, putative n=1 Tax=Medicago truncatula TaxID=3880 RepID=A0A072VGH4_MEDTR|nr:transmembrane protein, putative [Medicago truncatula]
MNELNTALRQNQKHAAQRRKIKTNNNVNKLVWAVAAVFHLFLVAVFCLLTVVPSFGAFGGCSGGGCCMFSFGPATCCCCWDLVSRQEF